ncbi:phage head closure protein [Pseudomonas shirazensis]|uniref:phage head closure protein n=1 Tax=Pseudomonas shirazensis TaxID=2745494 RepID=UPI003D2A08AA
MNKRCTLMQPEAVDRQGGGRSVTWLELGKVWAEISLPTGRTAPVADRLEVDITAEIKIRYRRDVVAGMRLVSPIGTYLVGAALPDRDPAMLRLLCSSVTNP